MTSTLSDVVLSTLSKKHWERELSTRELSVRELNKGLGPRRVYHRFPIRDGATMRELMFESFARRNPLLDHLRSRGDVTPTSCPAPFRPGRSTKTRRSARDDSPS